ncbi:hypothetical protein L1887_19549 [Cichorium endivia]|nr:hypothetical protein L1887_19549 [Cichorium endivia]
MRNCGLTSVLKSLRFYLSKSPTGSPPWSSSFLNASVLSPFRTLLGILKLDPILVVCGGSDLLKDRAKDYAERLKNFGKKVTYAEFEGQQHGFFTINPDSEVSLELMEIIKDLISKN